MSTEELIEEVRKREILYDPGHSEFKNVLKKNVEWESIGDFVGLSGSDAKRKWKNIKDSFRKYRQKLTKNSGQEAKGIKPYEYAQQLEFLIPHMAIRRMETNLHDISVMDIQASDSDSISNEGSPDELETGNNLAPGGKENEHNSNSSCPSGGPKSEQPRKKTRRCTQQSLDRDIEFFENAREQDENTLFFHSMAKLTSRLPLLVQLKLRLDIHKLVNDAFTEEV
ncbi:uncharacterized protein [Diadema antillarum]|uniref:uncharacterized protein isoform X2 n=1 Tax=Diadema antillarum TaxID=105358 RepID=UPI003A899868